MLARSFPSLLPETEALDRRFVGMALALGLRNLGRTWPNPSVGAVVVAERPDGPLIVGQGVTQTSGRPHAERLALEAAGAAARGATLYVSLEPCSHHGKTPPCVEAVLQSGIARVVTALEDPDRRVSGRGHSMLLQAGVAVTTGVLADEAGRAHRGHILRVTEGRPAVTLKLAQTADGYAARRGGERLLISGERSNARTHLMRAQADAIMVGVGTVLADDPLLTVRLPGLENRSPVRVVLDSRLRILSSSKVVQACREVPTWVIAGEGAPAEAERRLAEAGVEVIRVAAPAGRVAVRDALSVLSDRGITRVFSEGGPSLAEALIEADCVDEFATATSRTPLGEEGVVAIGPKLAAALNERFRLIAAEDLGADELKLYERAR